MVNFIRTSLASFIAGQVRISIKHFGLLKQTLSRILEKQGNEKSSQDVLVSSFH